MRSYMKRSDIYDLHKLNKVEGHYMKRNFKPTLEERVAYLENELTRRKNRTNEVGPVIAKIGQLILKNLPLILNALPGVIKALETDQMNDNSDKVELLKQFGEIGKKVGEMFKNAKG